MFGQLKSAVEFMEKWRTSGDLPYQIVGSLAALLVIASTVEGRRPSTIVSGALEQAGASGVARWFGAEAPPFLARQSAVVQQDALLLALFIVAVMALVPVWRLRWRDFDDFSFEVTGVIGARIAATLWLLLLIAAQQGPLTEFAATLRAQVPAVTGWVLLVLAATFVAHRFARRVGFGDFSGLLLKPLWRLTGRVVMSLGAALFALLFVAVSIPVSLLSWTCDIESEACRRTRIRAVESFKMPTGSL